MALEPCPRCRGRIFLERDTFGLYSWFCLSCGYRRDAKVSQLCLFEDKGREPVINVGGLFGQVLEVLERCGKDCAECSKRRSCRRIFDCLCTEQLTPDKLRYYCGEFLKIQNGNGKALVRD